ncbi:armadillo-type protein [Pyronema omphalodes]|nr:armadillo-type protein [Pyronema omphalodes]
MSKEIIDFINLNARYERDARTLKVTTTLIFRMACKDHSFIEFAVRLTKRIIENISSDIKDENVRDRSGKISYGAKLFRRYLLGIMQKDFEDGINYDLEDPEELAMRDSEPWNIEVRRQRWFGLVQLTAELFAAGLLTPKIAIEIVSALLQSSPSGKRVKSLVIFLQIAGNHLENTAKPHQKEELEAHFCTFQSLIDNSNLDPQLRFEIQELVDLRNSMAKETGI